MELQVAYFPTLENIQSAAQQLEGVALKTPLSVNVNLSKIFDANILFKREDLQVVRSYNIRGAYNKMSSLADSEKQNGIVY